MVRVVLKRIKIADIFYTSDCFCQMKSFFAIEIPAWCVFMCRVRQGGFPHACVFLYIICVGIISECCQCVAGSKIICWFIHILRHSWGLLKVQFWDFTVICVFSARFFSVCFGVLFYFTPQGQSKMGIRLETKIYTDETRITYFYP